MKSLGLYINGTYVQTRQHFLANNPTGLAFAPIELGTIHSSGEDSEIIEAALQGAHETFAQIQAGFFPLHERLNFLRKLETKLAEQSDNIASLMMREIGKPIKLCRQEVLRAQQTLSNTIRVAAEFFNTQGLPLAATSGFENYRGLVAREPRGPLLAITPFNYPLNLVMHKLAPAIAAGCPVILKPSPKSQLVALTLADFCHACELPPGMLNLIQCDNALTEKLIKDPRVEQFSFTGSAQVGWHLASLDVKPFTLELGGNTPVYVDPSAPLELAAQKVVQGSFSYAGQICISIQNIDVHKHVASEFKKLLQKEIEKFAWGNPEQEIVLSGPVIEASAAARLKALREGLLSRGAKSVGACQNKNFAGITDQNTSQYLCPEIFENIPLADSFYSEEIFGPYASLHTVDSFASWKKRVNEQKFRLQAGVFARDKNILIEAARDLRFGGVLLNESPTTRFDPMPYGGRGQSGRGREGARYALEEFTEYKTVIEKTDA